MMKTAFIGPGVMGLPMAAQLRQAGHGVWVYNRTSARADEWVTCHGGRRADTPAEAAQGADAVFTCVGADADLQQVVLGKDGALAAMRPGAVLVGHTTVSAKIARRLAEEAASKGLLRSEEHTSELQSL